MKKTRGQKSRATVPLIKDKYTDQVQSECGLFLICKNKKSFFELAHERVIHPFMNN
jgi:hypothetical protein